MRGGHAAVREGFFPIEWDLDIKFTENGARGRAVPLDAGGTGEDLTSGHVRVMARASRLKGHIMWRIEGVDEAG